MFPISLMADRTSAKPRCEIGATPILRLSMLNDRPPKAESEFVLYWMTVARRTRWSFALQRAVGWARELKRPLVIVEVLTCGGRWDSDRHHRFVLQGMKVNAGLLANTPALYYPFVEADSGECRKFFEYICARACVVVTDDYPIELPSVSTVDDEMPVRVEKIDGNGLLPLKAADQAFPTAYAFRRFLQRSLREYLLDAPMPDAFAKAKLPRLDSLPDPIPQRWPAASNRLLAGEPAALAGLPIDHSVPPVPTVERRSFRQQVSLLLRWKTDPKHTDFYLL